MQRLIRSETAAILARNLFWFLLAIGLGIGLGNGLSSRISLSSSLVAQEPIYRSVVPSSIESRSIAPPSIAPPSTESPSINGPLIPIEQRSTNIELPKEPLESLIRPVASHQTAPNCPAACCFGDWITPRQLGYGSHSFQFNPTCKTQLDLWATARAYYSADMRWEFTGQEETFAAEAQSLMHWTYQSRGWTNSVTGEFYLNQPFDNNILTHVNQSLRESFAHNFRDLKTFELSQMFLTVGRKNWAIDLGRFVTPFGRYYVPQTNNFRTTNYRFYAPFIRSECIVYRETGVQLRYQPGCFRLAAAYTNGSNGLDTNSSKAICSRVGIETEPCNVGISVKWQDGIGSENQKEYNNYAGFDLMLRRGRWRFSTEWIYNQYGLRRPDLTLNDITWGRSLYNRQMNNGLKTPCQGWGGYMNMIYDSPRCTAVLQYGEFHPQAITAAQPPHHPDWAQNVAIHNTITRRGLGQLTWRVNRHLEFINTGFIENRVKNAQDGRYRHGFSLLTGMQLHF